MNPKEILLAAVRFDAVREVLRTIIADADAKQAGTKAHLLAFILGASPCKTQKELAAKLGITPGRVCQMLRVLNRAYRTLS
jgi:DNA-binding MarR family transcriptional regulator